MIETPTRTPLEVAAGINATNEETTLAEIKRHEESAHHALMVARQDALTSITVMENIARGLKLPTVVRHLHECYEEINDYGNLIAQSLQHRDI